MIMDGLEWSEEMCSATAVCRNGFRRHLLVMTSTAGVFMCHLTDSSVDSYPARKYEYKTY